MEAPPLLVRYYVFPPCLMEAPPPCAVLCFSYLLNGGPPPPLCGTMFSTTRTGLPSGTLRAKFMEHSLVHESAISVYTDGSNCAKVWAFVTVFPHKVISDRLPSASSVFAAELWAVLPVVALMLRLFGTEFVVYSDPQNALRSIGHPFCHHPFVREIHRWLRTLRERGKALHFCWVPGTVGVTGNGKAATTHNRIAPTRLLARDYYSHFSAALRRRWLTSKQNIGTNKLRAVKDSVSPLKFLLLTESVPWSHSVVTTYWTHASDAPTSSARWWVSSLFCDSDGVSHPYDTAGEILWIGWCP